MSPPNKKIYKYLNIYKKYMEEIKLRSSLVQKVREKHINSQYYTGAYVTDIDLIYLQVRKICELIMFSCVVANQASSRELGTKLKKSYKPAEIYRLLSSINSRFYPRAVASRDWIPKSEESRNFEFPPLQVDELVDIWNKSGNYLHADRIHSTNKAQTKDTLEDVFNFMHKSITLLSHHWVRVDDNHEFTVIMQPVDDYGVFLDEVSVGIMKRVENENIPLPSNKMVRFFDES